MATMRIKVFLCEYFFYSVTGWLRASVIPLGMSLTILAIFQYFIKKLEKLTEPHDND